MPPRPAELGPARAVLIEAELIDRPADRFLAAHLAALRVAAVVLAARAHPSRSGRLRNVWQLLAEVAPEYAEWAGFFAAVGRKCEVVGAGAVALVGVREADDLIRDARLFHDEVARRLSRAGAQRATRT